MTKYDRIALIVIFITVAIFVLLLPKGEIKQDTSFEECQYMYNAPQISEETMIEKGCDIKAVEKEVARVKS